MDKRRGGNAYIMVMIAVMAIMMLVAVVLTITTSARRTTMRYIDHAGLYDLAVAGNEQALFLLRQGVATNRAQLNAAVRARLLADIEANLVYYNRRFYIASEPLAQFFVEETTPYALQNLQKYFTVFGLEYRRVWDMEVHFTVGGDIFTDRYHGVTTVSRVAGDFFVTSRLAKYIESARGHPVQVDARIIWPAIVCTCEFFPEFSWRRLPPVFSAAFRPNINMAAAIDLTLLPYLIPREEDDLLVLTGNSFDISEINRPLVIIHTGEDLQIFTSDTFNNIFRGIIISLGNVSFDDVYFLGNVWAGGEVVSTVSYSPDADLLFDIEITPLLRQYFFDFLRISNFTRAGSFSQISDVLGSLAISNGEIQSFCLDDYTLAMVELLRVTD